MEEESSAMYLCPNCGAFVSEKAEKCPHCGEKLEEPDDEDIELELDEIIEEDKKSQQKVKDKTDEPDAKAEPEIDDEEEGVALFLCSECGAFTAENEDVCSNCGASIGDEAEESKEEKPRPEHDVKKAAEKEKPVPDKKTPAPPASKDDKAPPSDSKDKAPPKEEDTLPGLDDDVLDMLVTDEIGELSEEDDEILDMIKGIKKPEDVGAIIDSISDEEGDLEELELVIPDETRTAESAEDDKDGIMAEIVPTDEEIKVEQEKIDALESVESKMKEAEEDKPPTEKDELGLCSKCGAFVSPVQKNCGVCGEELGADKIIVPTPTAKLILDKDVRPAKAQETLRKLLGILEGAELKQVEDKSQEDELKLCTICGAFLPDGVDKCGVCETNIEDMPDFVPPTMEEAKEDVSLAICPFCGVFLSHGAKTCTVCNKDIPDGASIDMISADDVIRQADDLDKASSILQRALGILELRDTEPEQIEDVSGSIDLCPECGAFVSVNSSICPVCGVTLMEGLDEVEEDILDLETTIEDLASIECPNCGSTIDVGSPECPLCGLAFETSEIVADVVEGIISDESAEDISDFLEKELPMTIQELEDKSIEVEEEPDLETMEIIEMLEPFQPEKDDDEGEPEVIELVDMLEPLQPSEGEETRDHEKSKDWKKDSFEQTKADIEETLEPSKDEELEDMELEKPVEADITEIEMPTDAERGGPFEAEVTDAMIDEPIDSDVSEVDEPIDGEITDMDGPIEVDISEIDVEPIEVEGPIEVDISEVEEVPESLVWEGDRISELTQEEIETVVVDVWPEDRRPVADDIAPEMPAAVARPAIEEITPAMTEVVERETVSIEEIPTYEDEPDYVVPERIAVQRLSVNWEYGIYGSVAAVILFIVFNTLAPGDYALALAVIFGALLLYGIYLAITEKGIIVKADFSRLSVFGIGSLIVAFIVLHWSAGIITADTGTLAQPGFDRFLISIGILLIGIGMIWLRPFTRYINIWFSGTFLLFLSAATYGQITGIAGTLSAALIVGGIGGVLVFLSLAFLTYEKAIRTSIDTDIVRGDAEYIRSDFESALASYDHALDKAQSRKSRAPMGYDVPWYSKGSALILMGELEEGLECLDMALAINPNNEVTWVNKGNAHSRLGQHNMAMECFDRAIALNPTYEIAWNNKGNILARQKRFVDALRCYNQAIKINPSYDDVWINKGYVLVKMGKQQEAMKCLNHIKARPQPASGPERPVQTA